MSPNKNSKELIKTQVLRYRPFGLAAPKIHSWIEHMLNLKLELMRYFATIKVIDYSRDGQRIEIMDTFKRVMYFFIYNEIEPKIERGNQHAKRNHYIRRTRNGI